MTNPSFERFNPLFMDYDGTKKSCGQESSIHTYKKHKDRAICKMCLVPSRSARPDGAWCMACNIKESAMVVDDPTVLVYEVDNIEQFTVHMKPDKSLVVKSERETVLAGHY